MPETPIYESQVSPQVTQTGGMQPDATPQAFGAGIGSAEETSAEVLTKLHHDAAEQADQTQALANDNALSDFKHRTLTDPKTGLLYQQLGKDAPGAADQAMAAYDKQAASISGSLTNDRQREQFGRMANARRMEMQDQLDRWSHGETERYTAETYQASVQNNARDAVTAAQQGDLETATDRVNAMKSVIADRGKFLGQPPEQVRALQDEAAASAHASVIDQLASAGNVDAAKQWYHDNLAELGKDAPAAKRTIDAVDRGDQALKLSDSLMVDAKGRPRDRATVDADVLDIQDPKLREETQRAVDSRFAHMREEQNDQQQASYLSGYTLAQTLVKDPTSKGLQDPALQAYMSKMDVAQQEHIQSYFAKDGKVSMPDAQFNALHLQAASPGTAKAFSDSVKGMAATMSEEQFDKALTWKQEIDANGFLGNSDGVRTRADVINRAMQDAQQALGGKYLIQTKEGTTVYNINDPASQQVADAVHRRIDAEEKLANGKLSYEKMQSVADDVVLHGVLNRSKDDSTKLLAANTLPSERANVYTDLFSRLVSKDPEVQAAAQAERDHIWTRASEAGHDPSKLTPDQYNRAAAQRVLGEQLHKLGDDNGALEARNRMVSIISEGPKLGFMAKPPPPPTGVTIYKPYVRVPYPNGPGKSMGTPPPRLHKPKDQ